MNLFPQNFIFTKFSQALSFLLVVYWQKSKIDPLTFSLFHFSRLTFSFVISVIWLSIVVIRYFVKPQLCLVVNWAKMMLFWLFFLINLRIKRKLKKNWYLKKKTFRGTTSFPLSEIKTKEWWRSWRVATSEWWVLLLLLLTCCYQWSSSACKTQPSR